MRPDVLILDKPLLFEDDATGIYSDKQTSRDWQPREIDMHDYKKTRQQIWERNRVDFARMFYNKGQPYSLRKYKRIFKEEMTKRPSLYDVLDKDGKPKKEINGILNTDPRFLHNVDKVSVEHVKLPADFEE